MKDFSMLDTLKNYKDKNRSSFHTPGHKANLKQNENLFNLLQYDLTELSETGSLFDGIGLTAEAERAATAFFKTKGTFFSTGGCTLPIQTMLCLALSQGEKLLCSRTIHRSAVNAMVLLDIKPVWLMPDMSAGEHFSGRIRPQQIKEALQKDDDIKAVYITSPDYFGVLSDISAISLVCKEYSLPLLIDNAHGSHLKWTKPALHPIDQGATMCADSAHKTLPVLTGGAWLHIMNDSYLPDVRPSMSLFASTSPSYPIMASLDLCRQWLEKEGFKEMGRLQEKVQEVKDIFINQGFQLPRASVDPVRISVYTPSAQRLNSHLKKHGIEAEYASDEHIILIPSPFNTENDFQKLKSALKSFKNHINLSSSKNSLSTSLPRQVLSPREAVFSKTEILPASFALGRISADTPCLCPPGIPLVVPGELIDKTVIENLANNGIKNIKVVK